MGQSRNNLSVKLINILIILITVPVSVKTLENVLMPAAKAASVYSLQ